MVEEVRPEGEGEQAAAGRVGLLPDLHAVALPARVASAHDGGIGQERGHGRLHRQRHPELLGHVEGRGEVVGHLGRAGHGHHVRRQASPRGEEGPHGEVALLRHPGVGGGRSPWPVPGRQEPDPQLAPDLPALLQVPVQLGRHHVHVRERAAGELELPARLDGDGELAALGGDDSAVLLEGRVAALLEGAQHRRDPAGPLVGQRLEAPGDDAQLLVLEPDLPVGPGPLACREPATEVADLAHGRRGSGSRIERHGAESTCVRAQPLPFRVVPVTAGDLPGPSPPGIRTRRLRFHSCISMAPEVVQAPTPSSPMRPLRPFGLRGPGLTPYPPTIRGIFFCSLRSPRPRPDMTRHIRLFTTLAGALALTAIVTVGLGRASQRPEPAASTDRPPATAAAVVAGAAGEEPAAERLARAAVVGRGQRVPGSDYQLERIPVAARAIMQLKDHYVDPLALQAEGDAGGGAGGRRAQGGRGDGPGRRPLAQADADGGRGPARAGHLRRELDLGDPDQAGRGDGVHPGALVARQDLREIEYAAANGMLSTLDPHTVPPRPRCSGR